MGEPLHAEWLIADIGQLGERADVATVEFNLARKFVRETNGRLTGLENEMIGLAGNGPVAGLDHSGRVLFAGSERADANTQTGVSRPRQRSPVARAVAK